MPRTSFPRRRCRSLDLLAKGSVDALCRHVATQLSLMTLRGSLSWRNPKNNGARNFLSRVH